MNIKYLVYDLETLKRCFFIGIYLPDEKRKIGFSVNEWENQLDSFINFVEKYKDYYWVGYNSLRFDSQVIEWVIRNYEEWHELSNLEICQKIARKASDVIHDANYEVFPEYSEYSLSLKQIDLFKLMHYDNKNRQVSLKRLEFEMDMENIEEMPIHHNSDTLTKEDVQNIKDYCFNDLDATLEFWNYVTGNVEHPLYKGNNQVQFRLDVEQEFKISCMNFSNAKIGDEIIKKYYCEEKGITYKQLPKKGFFRKEIALKYCIPKNISFKTKQLQEFLDKAKKTVLKMDEDFKESIKFYGQEYTFAKGGLHNVINGKIYESDNENDIVDIDVSGFYPASIINFSYYPFHLGKEFLAGYSKVYFKRIELKPLAKKDKRIKGIVGGLKEAGNCPYGKSSDMQSWLYDKQMTLATCLTGEFSLLMLIEECELNSIKCIMANTDGATFIVPKIKYDLFTKIKEEWREKMTNKLTYELEEVKYKKMVFSTVNDYLAIKEDEKADEKVKLKGDFMKDFELHKNKSKRIIPIALEKYYVDGIPIEETIRNHKNIFDFCIRQKASKDFHYEGVTKHGKNIYKKLIRYYISNKGEKLFKIKNPQCLTNAAPISQVEAGEWMSTVCNYLKKDTDISTLDINYDYYIQGAQDIINKIKLEGRKKVAEQPKNQLSLKF